MFTRTLCALIVVPFFILGCGNTSNPQSNLQNLGGSNFAALGNGRFISATGFSGTETGVNYQIKATFNPGGMLAIVSHSDNALQNGVFITFSRAGNMIAVAVNGVEVNRFAKAVDAEVELQVEVHNDEAPAHVIIADSLVQKPALLFNSGERGKELPASVKGKGDKWGLILADVNPTSVAAGNPKLGH